MSDTLYQRSEVGSKVNKNGKTVKQKIINVHKIDTFYKQNRNKRKVSFL